MLQLKLTEKGTIRINFRDFLPEDSRRLRCNFRCSYCLQYAMREICFSEKEYEQCTKIWDLLATIEDHILVRFNFDGEILADPWAQKIVGYVSRLANVQVCEIITNNSVHPKHYLHEWDVPKMSFNCSFHPECISLGRFLSHIQYLREQHCPVFVTMVVTPQLINQLPKIAGEFKKHNIHFHPLLLLGPYWGLLPKWLRKFCNAMSWEVNVNVYPRAYHRRDLQLIRNKYCSELEFKYQYGEKTKGKLCHAGVDMVNVFMDGTVRRCFASKIGTVEDLISGKIYLSKEPLPCPADLCQCPTHIIFLKEFRDKYSLSEQFVDHRGNGELFYA
jgi:sulfatase maturation enzyme AslB (radical SAM superfamily)